MRRRDLAIASVGLVLGCVAIAAGLGVGAGGTADAAGPTDVQFRDVSGEVGFTYNTSEVSGVMSSAGLYAADYDGDGWTDLLATGGSRPVLFENDGGTFTASDQLDGIDLSVETALFFDYDGDSDEDLLLFAESGETVMLRNDDGRLGRVAGVLNATFAEPSGATAGDYDRDGCLDLFVFQNGDWSDRRPAGSDEPDLRATEDNGNPNYLYRGTCGGFENVTGSAGVRGTSWSLAASLVDFDGDGYQDIHVANDFNHDVLYWNEGNGTFTRTVLPAETNRNAMSSEVEDFTGNGRPDLFVTNIYLPPDIDGSVAMVADGRAVGNNLLVNAGDRRFSPAGERCGVDRGGWGWAAVGADLDNDGDTDLVHTTLEFTLRLGTELLDARERSPDYSYPVVFERREGDCAFASLNASASGFERTDGHGLAGTDFDRDGDVDVAMATSPGPTGDARYRLYENVGATGGAIQVRVQNGTAPVVGARVHVTTPEGAQTRVLNARRDYYSQDERVAHFGLGNRSRADVRVVWPDGTTRTFDGVAAGQRLVVSRDRVERVSLEESPGGIGGTDIGRLDIAIALLGVLSTALCVALLSRRRGR